MNYLKRLSITNKLIGILLVVTAFTLGAGFTFVIFHDIATFKKEMMDSTEAMARVIGDYSVVDLTFNDPDESRKTLAKISSNPAIDSAALYTTSGGLFSYYSRSGMNDYPTRAEAPSVTFRSGSLHVFQQVFYQDKFYGTIYLRASTKALDAKIHSYLITIFTVLAALIVISIVLAVKLQRFISDPILDLGRATKRLSEQRDYSIRVEKTSDDEIGTLCDEFNNMLVQLEKRKQERDVAEEALRESETRYRVLVESSPEAIFLEQNRQIVFVNSSALKLSGYENLAEIRNQSLNALFPSEAGKDLLNLASLSPVEMKLLKKDKSGIEVEVMFIRTTFQGIDAVQALARDITESKSLRQSAERMQRLAALGEFSAILAHEIRNSLGSIGLNLKILSEHVEVPEAHKKNLANIKLGTERIQAIMKGVLDFARPAPPNLRKVSLKRVLDNALHAVDHELQRSPFTIVRDYSPDDPHVLADPNQINQVFVNLLLNAKNAMERGGTITLGTRMIDGMVEASVTDSGRGSPRKTSRKSSIPSSQ